MYLTSVANYIYFIHNDLISKAFSNSQPKGDAEKAESRCILVVMCARIGTILLYMFQYWWVGILLRSIYYKIIYLGKLIEVKS